jgi:hypothetical protein
MQWSGKSAATIECRDDHAHRCADNRRVASASRRAEQSERNQRQRVTGNVEYQNGQGEKEQTLAGEHLDHLEHTTYLGR